MDIKTLFAGVNTTTNRSNNQQDRNATQASVNDADDANVKSSGLQEKVTLTATAARFTQIQTMMSSHPEVNKDRVAELRRAIAEGSYKVDAGRLAGRMMSFESALHGKS